MNDFLQERLRVLADDFQLQLITAPRNAPLVSGEEIILKKEGLEIFKIRRRAAAAESPLNKLISVYLSLNVEDPATFQIKNKNWLKGFLSYFTNESPFTIRDSNVRSRMEEMFFSEIAKPYWNKLKYVKIKKDPNKLSVELKSSYEEPIFSATSFLIDVINQELSESLK